MAALTTPEEVWTINAVWDCKCAQAPTHWPPEFAPYLQHLRPGQGVPFGTGSDVIAAERDRQEVDKLGLGLASTQKLLRRRTIDLWRLDL